MRLVATLSTVLFVASTHCASAQALRGQLKDVNEPTEVGTTTMPAGQYAITEQVSGKSFNLTVTSKGLMILSPSNKAGAASTPAAATTAQPAAAGAAAPAAAAATAPTSATQDALKGLMQKGVQKGMQELMKSGAQKQLQKIVK